MGNPCISTFYTLKETSKQFQPHFIVPSAVPEKGEKEDKGDGNFPCERRRESLILQWRMEIENREPHLVPTYFCCVIQKNSADDQKSVNLQYISLTLAVLVFRRQKNQPLLIQRSRPLRDSQEPKTRKKFQFP